jgi:glutamate racemase
MKIGVFDSGVGGLTVLAELRKRFGFIDFVYLGDTAHVPYGTKSPAQIEKLSSQCAQILKEKKIQALVVACNTASSWALGAIEQVMGSVPVFGTVAPGVEATVKALQEIRKTLKTAESTVLVLATRATVQSHAYEKSLRPALDQAFANESQKIQILEQACPLLVPMIEEGWIDHPILHQTIQEYVKSYLDQFPPGVALLGCTHYPWIHTAFQKAMPGWTVVNSACAIADSLKIQTPQSQNPGKLDWIFTDPDAVPRFAKLLIENNQI